MIVHLQPQRVVLPEAMDPRVLTAASELSARGLAHVVLLGQPERVAAQARKLHVDISKARAPRCSSGSRDSQSCVACCDARAYLICHRSVSAIKMTGSYVCVANRATLFMCGRAGSAPVLAWGRRLVGDAATR